MAKIFSLALRNRLNKWCENQEVFSDMQFGFRNHRSTADCVFILHSIIKKVLANRSSLYCCFVDYEKAFDTVNRQALWSKLFEIGVSSKMLKILTAIYKNVSACIKSFSGLSEFFEVSLGLKQGEPLSPILFLLFVNDVACNMNFNALTEYDLDQLCIFMLLFADDMVLFTTSPASLQAQLDNLYYYSQKWGLKINIKKTKICIFSKQRRTDNFEWNINNEVLEIVESFCYLGIKFTKNGLLKNAIKALSDQSLRAVNGLYTIFTRLKLDVKTKLLLFDRMVMPILTYCSEIWGIHNTTDIEKVHLRFCKKILGVKNSTPNIAVLGELGRYPLSVICKERVLKYWLKIRSHPNSIMFNIFDAECNSIESANCLPWVKAVKTILDNIGYSYLWNSQNINMSLFPKLQRRIRDNYLQEWQESIMTYPKLEYYVKFKTSFGFEPYLSAVNDDYLRKLLSCFRLSAHCLAIETGRYSSIDRRNRLCQNCNQNKVESEYHFLMCCPLYKDLRQKFLPKFCLSWPNINKFNLVLNSNNHRIIVRVCKFLKEAYKLRSRHLDG
jgi:hypothetical protein